jgi:hypothetical protein
MISGPGVGWVGPTQQIKSDAHHMSFPSNSYVLFTSKIKLVLSIYFLYPGIQSTPSVQYCNAMHSIFLRKSKRILK